MWEKLFLIKDEHLKTEYNITEWRLTLGKEKVSYGC